MIDPHIRQFLEELLNRAGMNNLDAEVKEQMIKDLNESLEDKLLRAALDNLSEKKAEELSIMADTNCSAAEIQGFLQANIPNLEQVNLQAMREFTKHYID